MFRGPLEDRVAIRERIESYTDPVICHDANAWAENWAEDAVWVMNPDLQGKPSKSIFTSYYELVGKKNIVEFWSQAMDTLAYATFIPSIAAISANGNDGTARVYMSAQERFKEGFFLEYLGRYDDQLRKEGGTWLFTRREYRVLRWR